MDATKWVDSHKELFRVSVSAVSTVHPQDGALDRFLRACHVVDNCYSGGQGSRSTTTAGDSFAAEVKCAIQGEMAVKPNLAVPISKNTALPAGLGESCLEPLVRFSTLVLDRLLLILVRPPVFSESKLNFSQIAFEAITQIVNRICASLPEKNDRHGRSSLLTSYIKFAASIPVAEVMPPATSQAGGLTRPLSMPSGCQIGLNESQDDLSAGGGATIGGFPASATSVNLHSAGGQLAARNRKVTRALRPCDNVSL